jgi:hypothetical protein
LIGFSYLRNWHGITAVIFFLITLIPMSVHISRGANNSCCLLILEQKE